MPYSLQHSVQYFSQKHQLPPEFAKTAENFYFPLAQYLKNWINLRNEFCVIGINGAQGTGKSTLTDFLVEVLSKQGVAVESLSLDDLYLSREERLALAEDVHPLLATRGVPGTHDIELGTHLIAELRNERSVFLPSFDKAIDDRRVANSSQKPVGPLQALILEGWCLGVEAEGEASLKSPINLLEASEDADGTWRNWVNRRLMEDYPRLFNQVEKLIFLKAPNFDAVLRWRSEQEEKLAQKNPQGSQLMSTDQIARFIQHYERLTNACLRQLPERADVVFELNEDHGIDNVHYTRNDTA